MHLLSIKCSTSVTHREHSRTSVEHNSATSVTTGVTVSDLLTSTTHSYLTVTLTFGLDSSDYIRVMGDSSRVSLGISPSRTLISWDTLCEVCSIALVLELFTVTQVTSTSSAILLTSVQTFFNFFSQSGSPVHQLLARTLADMRRQRMPYHAA